MDDSRPSSPPVGADGTHAPSTPRSPSWLQRSSRLVRTFRRANWAVADQAVISLGNFVSVYLLARFLPIADFGVFTLMFTGLMVAVGVQNALISKPHNVVGARLEGAAYVTYTSAMALFQTIVAVSITVLLVVVGAVLAGAFAIPTGSTLVVLGIVALPWLYQEFVRRTFYTRSHARAALVNDAVCYVLQAVGIAGLVLTSTLSIEAALWVMGASSLVATGLGAWQLRHVVTLDARAFRPDALRDAWGRSWGLGRWLTARAAVDWFRGHGHTWLLAAMVGVDALGMYRAAYHLVNVLNPITMAVQSYIPSRASRVLERGGSAALASWTRRTSLLAGALYTVVVLAVIALSGELLTLFYGDRFADAQGVLQWVIVLSAVEKLARKFTLFPSTVLLVMERVRSLFVLDVVSMVLMLGAGFALIGAFGILGAPLAKLVVALFVLAVLVVRSRAALATPGAPGAAPVGAER